MLPSMFLNKLEHYKEFADSARCFWNFGFVLLLSELILTPNMYLELLIPSRDSSLLGD
jgi:hypothetical protein